MNDNTNSYDNRSAHHYATRIENEVKKAVRGKDKEIRSLVCVLLAGGHVLIEDVPGVGKTTLARALAKAAGLDFSRAQFTPDVMASDITGFNMYNRKTESFEFKKGLVDTNILLADEINRASPKTQSSLLEAMEERKYTVDGVTYETPTPFMVIATQNPQGFVGTFPLPEAQLDRFSLRISMGYPEFEDELAIMRNRKSEDPMESVRSVGSPEVILACKKAVERVFVSEEIEKYIVTLVSETRKKREFILGASPRASLNLMRLSRALAFMSGREYVIPEDVAFLYLNSVSHRISLSREAIADGHNVESVLRGILNSTKVPFVKIERSR